MTKLTGLQPGSKYGRLTVIKYAGIHKKPCGSTQCSYECLCDCGNRVTVLMQALKSGNTKSCGCLANEVKHNKRLPDHKGVINHIILQYKRHAKDRNLCWELDYENVRNLILSPCFYCGAENSNHKVTKNCKEGFDHNGIDRIDSSRGYFLFNASGIDT